MALNTNVGPSERILSVLGGIYLLYNTLAKKKVSMVETMAGTYLLLRGITGFCLAYQRLGKKEVDYRPPNINIRTIMIVNRPRDQVYAFWRRLENLPLFMKHLKKVTVLDENTSEWTAALTGDVATLSWKSEIVKDDPGATLSWHSIPDSSIENAGKITFKDAGASGTRVNVVISYHAPMGVLGETAGRLLNPVFEKMVNDDVRNFKLYMETTAKPSIAP
jgi:Predicted integral membrane protein